MNTTKTFFLALGLCFMTGHVVGQSAPVYKWVDESGVTHYGSQPPSNENFKATDVRAKRTNAMALQNQLTEQADLRNARNVRKGHAAEQESNAKAQRKEIEEQRSTNCQKSQEQLTAYDSAPRLYKALPDGEREYLSDEQLDAERANARRQVREWCD